MAMRMNKLPIIKILFLTFIILFFDRITALMDLNVTINIGGTYNIAVIIFGSNAIKLDSTIFPKALLLDNIMLISKRTAKT